MDSMHYILKGRVLLLVQVCNHHVTTMEPPCIPHDSLTGRVPLLVQEALVAVRFAGEVLGEDSLLRERVAPWTAMAGDWCELMRLKGSDFRELAQAHPELLQRVEMHEREKRAGGDGGARGEVSLNARCHEIRLQQQGYSPSADGGVEPAEKTSSFKQRSLCRHGAHHGAHHPPAARPAAPRRAPRGVEIMKAAIAERRRLTAGLSNSVGLRLSAVSELGVSLGSRLSRRASRGAEAGEAELNA